LFEVLENVLMVLWSSRIFCQ